ncbi:MAG: hypothetical protein O6850_03100, partial [Acidobacteria bacterium]|nr:hypothetical protein [Acidobacteriota bacterium]
TIVDGGVLSNFPIRYFTSRDPGVVKVMGDTDPDAVPNLGLLIDEGKPVANSGYARDPEDVDGLREGILEFLEGLKTVGRLRRLVDSMTNARDNQAIQEHKKEICRLPAKGYGTTEFDMSKERRNAMVEAGRKAMKEYFDRQKQNQPSGSPQPQKISVSVETGEKQ